MRKLRIAALALVAAAGWARAAAAYDRPSPSLFPTGVKATTRVGKDGKVNLIIRIKGQKKNQVKTLQIENKKTEEWDDAYTKDGREFVVTFQHPDTHPKDHIKITDTISRTLVDGKRLVDFDDYKSGFYKKPA